MILAGAMGLMLSLASAATKLENMQFLTSDSQMTCAQEDFKLELDFDGTGENVKYAWNGQAGESPVTWKDNVATFGLADAVNGPFHLRFRDARFYFVAQETGRQDRYVLCVESFK